MDGRMAPEDVDATIDYASPVPLFRTRAEAAAHGLTEVNAPSARAVEAMSKISQVRSDLITREKTDG